jgi:nonsense-mediated mRNA decay protein 3
VGLISVFECFVERRISKKTRRDLVGMAMAQGAQGPQDMFTVPHTVGRVLCCMCGVSMAPNAANMCVACLRSQVDITEGLQKFVTVLYCPECGRYLQPPRTWVKAELESKELLTFCIKRLKNINKVRLVDAGFVWTEPHSKRLKVKLKIQKEVVNGAILEQGYVVEYTVEDHMCEKCSRVAANPDQWIACVQVRQKVDHKRTFFFLEQLIIKHNAAASAINIKQMHEGVDFYFANRSHALKYLDFLSNVVPTKSRHDKQLVSHDTKSNTYNYRFTMSVEICPVCKDDLICLPQKVAAGLGNIGPLVLCMRVSNSLLLLDPQNLRNAYVDASQYWRVPYRPLLSSRQLVEYVVLDIEHDRGVGSSSGKFALADVQVARIADFGKNDTTFSGRTHLGHLLKVGDYALGYDLYGANTNDLELDKYKGLVLPDVVLVKKSYEEKRQRKRGKARPWKLKALPMEIEPSAGGKQDEEKRVGEYERFLEELEEDPEMRSKIALYRDVAYREQSETGSMTDGEEPPSVPLEELLADLRLEESSRAESEFDEDMDDS